ncbi:2-hydroxyacid dehydrogenase [Elioraea sp.]|uniref:2-hydroxyacid dehydrogenase n=1 Tax=Elioraea sp. TaxID=2185103 RepID=UPI0025C399AD|nr:2-hydroxyacid dehydrogenase [Elioraea sp.]
MRVHLLGDTARQADRLRTLLGEEFVVTALPREAASSPAHDSEIASDDVVIALRFSRSGGAAPRFRLLHAPGAGLDGISMDQLAPETAVCNVFEHEAPIAEFVLWAMLRWEIRPEAMRFTAETWADAYRTRAPHGELLGKTVGIIGFGRIGQAVAQRARAFGMRVATLDRSPGAAGALADLLVPRTELPALLGASDYVVICAPLTPDTTGMVGAAEFRAMKPTGVLINIARAEIVQEEDLYVALRDGVIGGAYLDVWYAYPNGTEDRPPPSRFPFLDLPNVVATPHSSAWTTALPGRRYRVIAENIRRLRDGLPLLNVVRAARSPRAVEAT